MTIELRPYQSECVDALFRYFERSDGHPLVEMPTASGKSLTMAGFIKDAITAFPETRVLVATHRKELIEQDAAAIRKLWPDAPVGIYSAGLHSRQVRRITVAGVQTVHKKAAELGHVSLLLIDEAHLTPFAGEGMYRRLIRDLTEINPALKIVGFTATPYRLSGGLLTRGTGHIFTSIAYKIPVQRLVDEGWLSPLVSPSTSTTYSTDGVGTINGDFAVGELQSSVDHQEAVTRAALAESLELAKGRRAGIVFCVSVQHAQLATAILRERGETAAMITGDTDDLTRSSMLSKFKRGEVRWLVGIDVLTTGFDAPICDVIVILRPTQSAGLYVQVCLDEKTEILTRYGWAGVGAVGIGEDIAAFDIETGKGAWSPVLGVVDRQTVSGEKMASISTPRLDIRVTKDHDMVLRTRKFSGGWSPWKKRPAQEVAEIRDGYQIPSAVTIDGPGVPLTDDELRFIGLFMTDGTLNRKTNAITIYQSERYPDVLKFIENTIAGCGFKYGRTSRNGDMCFGKPRTHAVHRFTVSKGAPRGRDRHLRGWGAIDPYVSKDFSPLLMDCTRAQLLVLAEAIHMGDGCKTFGVKKNGWTSRTYSISSGRRSFVDRLQALCVTRGLSSGISTQVGGGRKSPIHIITIGFGATRHVGGSGQRDRDHLRVEDDQRPERVWCVTTAHGTIVTRRNGKVAVVGNCGRGMRLYDGKADCLVLDYGGNVERHGPITDIRHKSLSAGESKMVKECPNCMAEVKISKRECPECGFIFPEQPRDIDHDKQASRKAIMGPAPEPVWVEIDDVRASEWIKRPKEGEEPKPPTVCVEYLRGGRAVVKEWLCPEHGGYAAQKFCRWWFDAGGDLPAPHTVALALERFDELKRIEAVQVGKDGQYDRVMARRFGDAPDAKPGEVTVHTVPAAEWVDDDPLPF